MKWILFLGLVCFPSLLFAGFPRKVDNSIVVFQNSGDQAVGISVSVSAVTPTHVYDPTDNGVDDREVLLQNTSTSVYIYCSTSSTGFTVSSGPRFALPPAPTGFTTNGTFDIWCLSASGTIEVIGSAEFNGKD